MIGRVYSLRVPNNDELVYYGSTTIQLSTRLAQHKADYTRFNNGNFHFITSFNVVKHDNVYTKCEYIIEHDNIDTLKGLLKEKEREYIINNKCVNLHKPSNKQYNKYLCGACNCSVMCLSSHYKTSKHIKLILV